MGCGNSPGRGGGGRFHVIDAKVAAVLHFYKYNFSKEKQNKNKKIWECVVMVPQV